MIHILTANRLLEGNVVYWTEAGWNPSIHSAQMVESAENAGSLLEIAQAEAKACRVVEPYLIKVELIDDLIEPVHYRERMRTKGPTVRPDLGKQSQAA